MWYLILLIFGFCAGSIPFGYILAKVVKKIDIRKYGSGNIGATNVWRVCGKKLGIPAFILDAAKGFLPVFLIKVGETVPLRGINPALCCGVGAILGHSFTPWLKFRGGKGVATGLGVFIGLAPIESGIAFAIWGLILIVSKWVSVASIGAAAVLVILIFLTYRTSPISFFVLAGFLLVVLLHRSNIRRLIQGKEPKIGNLF